MIKAKHTTCIRNPTSQLQAPSKLQLKAQRHFSFTHEDGNTVAEKRSLIIHVLCNADVVLLLFISYSTSFWCCCTFSGFIVQLQRKNSLIQSAFKHKANIFELLPSAW